MEARRVPSFLRIPVRLAGRGRARDAAAWIAAEVPRGSSILDIGAGLGQIAHELRALGYCVVTLDNLYVPIEVGPHVRASATSLPFAAKAFDVVLFAFVLHHTPADVRLTILGEARRVARLSIVLLEDVFRSQLERRFLQFADSLVNLEFGGHPHSNLRSEEWLHVLRQVNLEPRLSWERIHFWLFLPFRHALLVGHVAP